MNFEAWQAETTRYDYLKPAELQPDTRYMDYVIASKQDYIMSLHGYIICTEIQALLDRIPGHENLLIMLPPGYGKTEHAIRRLITFVFGTRLNFSILYITYGDELSNPISKETREIMETPGYQQIFPLAEPISDKDKEWYTSTGCMLRATGIGGSFVGRHFDLLLIDDLFKSQEEADSAPVRKKRLRILFNDVLSREKINRYGRIPKIVIGTQRRGDDHFAQIQKEMEEGGEQYRIVKLPAYLDEKGAKKRHELDTRELYEPLWLIKHTFEELKRIEARNYADFMANFQQRPTNLNGDKIKTGWFNVVENYPNIEKMILNRGWCFPKLMTQTGDQAHSTVLVGRDKNKDLYILDCSRNEIGFETAVDDMRDKARKEKRVKLRIRRCNGKPEIKAEIERNVPFGRFLKEVDAAQPLAWTPMAKRGRIKVVKADWNKTFFDAVVNFSDTGQDSLESVIHATSAAILGYKWSKHDV